MTTPKRDGFRMPAEYEPHRRTWMIFPTRGDNWRNDAKEAQSAFVGLAKTISLFEDVTMLVDPDHADAFERLDPKFESIPFITDDAWIRDTGATFVTNDKELRGVDWDFNAWGGTFDGLCTSWENDSKVASAMGGGYKTPGFVLEGGSIHVDGEGTCITTKECLLSYGRNPHMTMEEIEEKLKEYLGVDKVIWLDDGIVDDETNGHVDNMACFARPGEVILAWTNEKKNPQYERSKRAYETLSNSTDAKGRPFKIHKLHVPRDMYRTVEETTGITPGEMIPRRQGDRLCASYVNFYLPNGGVVMPFFDDDKYDKLAYHKLAEIFPDRAVVGFYAREILLGGGGIHCSCMQEPLV